MWKHQQCGNHEDNPDESTSFVDRSCDAPPPRPPLFRPRALYRAVNLATILDRPTIPDLNIPALQVNYGQSSNTSDSLPKSVQMTLSQGSEVTSMDFHPQNHLLLLVGTKTGDLSLWDIGSRKKLVHKNFMVWDLVISAQRLKLSLKMDFVASINRVTWNPDGTLLGVAYSKSLVHIYSYHGGNDMRNVAEIDVHQGRVNGFAFCFPDLIVTCGDDALIKVHGADSGCRRTILTGHQAPVNSICPQFKENMEFIISTSIDGKIRVWSKENMGSSIEHDAPDCSAIKMAYSDDGTRLFASGISKEGRSYISEWDRRKGTMKQMYEGIGRLYAGDVNFDTTKNRFLAAGDEFLIKFWDLDRLELLSATDAEGGLPVSACVRFNKVGNLLAVSTIEGGIKVLANEDGASWLLKAMEKCSFGASTFASTSKIWRTTK